MSGPAHGTLTLNADGSFTYTPDANFNGPDSFTYKANDGDADSQRRHGDDHRHRGQRRAGGASTTATARDEDTPLDGRRAPACSATTPTSTATPDGGPGQPARHGTLDAERRRHLHLHAGANYNGTDSFTYKANDGARDSNTATVTLTINPVNDIPVAQNDLYATSV